MRITMQTTVQTTVRITRRMPFTRLLRVAGLAVAFLAALIVGGASGSSAVSGPTAATASTTFRVVDVYVDSSAELSAYQLVVTAERGGATVVGVEGGEAPLDAPPFYDPAALSGGKIILAAFTKEGALPAGRHRVASLHVQETASGVRYVASIQAAADSTGARQTARVSVEPRQEVKR